MWLFTRYGFYSVVQDKLDDQRVQVRARVRADLEALQRSAAGELRDVEIIMTPHADYRYRIVVPRAQWCTVAGRLSNDIDYVNFKNEVHGEADRDDAYLAVWSAMNRLQSKRG